MIADSGERRVFDTGAQRDRQVGKGRMDLLPYRALIEVSKLFEQGAIKYESRNWEKGMPVKEFLDSGARHHAKCMIGELDEPHLVQWCWNALCALDTYLRIKEGTLSDELMEDLPFDSFRLMEGPSDKESISLSDFHNLVGELCAESINETLAKKKERGVNMKTGPPIVGGGYQIFDSFVRILSVDKCITYLAVSKDMEYNLTFEAWKRMCELGVIYLFERPKDNGPTVGDTWSVYGVLGEVTNVIDGDVIVLMSHGEERYSKESWERGVKTGDTYLYDRPKVGTIRSTPKIGDIYSVFHRLERIVDVTPDHVSTGVAVYTSDEWNKYYRLGYINFHCTGDKGPKDQRTVDPGPEVKGPEVKGPLTFEYQTRVPVSGQLYSVFNKPWKVVNLEGAHVVLQSNTTGEAATVTWNFWKKHVASGDIYLAGESK